MSDVDDNPRPLKRQRTFSLNTSSPLSSPPDTPPHSQPRAPAQPPSLPSSSLLAPIPTQTLLVSLPGIIVHPPNHPHHARSLYVSLLSLRRCLALKTLNPDVECRAWTALAEVGMKVVAGGFSQSDDYPWARGTETEVEKAIGKGHPSLRAYRHHLSLLNAHFSQWQHNFKFSRSVLRRAISALNQSDPPHIVYTAHLALIEHLSSSTTPQDIYAALDAVNALQSVAINNAHPRIVLLTHVLNLRICTAAEMWDRVQLSLSSAEGALGLSYDPAAPGPIPQPQHAAALGVPTSADVTPKAAGTPAQESTFVFFEDPFEVSMALHTLMIGVTFYTHVGLALESSPRLSHLHALLDSGALERFPLGIVEVTFPSSPSLSVKVTHPRVVFLLTYLISTTAKRDPVGRKSKRKIFAAEGLAIWEKEIQRELKLPTWAGVADAYEIEQQVVRIKTDLLCELIAVSIQRSEFDAAEENLAILIAHTRTYDIFQLYAARITLHHAHLAHALGNTARALQCYKVAAHVAEKGSFVAVSARAGEIALQIGLMYDTHCEDQARSIGEVTSVVDDRTKTAGLEVARVCRSMGGTLEAVGQIIESALTTEILKSKQYLKQALGLASKAQENHIRALILALISSHYFHTASDHAQTMLLTCEQLAAGLGAAPTKAEKGKSSNQKADNVLVDTIGNAPLRLWVGERFLELYKRAGKDERVKKQLVANRHLLHATQLLVQRGSRAFG
ncbi:hypothetical protein SERLADRAFT_418607 [Serpula lacrymans var. lacrymans S7.9]|uniref:Anaphase-promoting complex subunit 5 n=1 Tax=Serpula lacrymans var. lacrymans (strain S7.9) TaxID=578457 RepID=F8PD87_SERL9|nr:uncharacterized protein SERLADRAFT_418607 [Serpula lacrymans var. lacrymans S7.9]EGO18936.1 hypothetical protein SERLADRAFT_418607 [Serpula lacrymans var. lacrymans S7.9]